MLSNFNFFNVAVNEFWRCDKHSAACWNISKVNINSFYGFRNHPVHKVSLFHRGIDLKGATGEKAIATGDGDVIDVGFKVDLGNYIKIKHCFVTLKRTFENNNSQILS